MALVVDGVVAAMAPGRERDVDRRAVFIGDDGLVDTVAAAGATGPGGFDGAARVDVGDAFVYPGLIDLHSHLAFNMLPLWVDPDRQEEGRPFRHHDEWPRADSYPESIPWPAWTLLSGAPECTLAYVQVRALAGGTTAIEGWPGTSRPATNRLVRSVDNDQVGPLRDPVRVSTLTDVRDLDKRVKDVRAGRLFIRHCGEGTPSDAMRAEFEELRDAPDPELPAGADPTGCVNQNLVVIHGCGLHRDDFAQWRRLVEPGSGETAGTVVWSPFSNLWLYGITADIPTIAAQRLAITLGTDWGPSGTKNLLGELKVARLWADRQGWDLDDHELVRMVTASPGDALARAWQTPAGRLVPGGLGDLVVVARRHDDPWTNLVRARQRDVLLVAVGGEARLGTKAMMDAVGRRDAVVARIGAVHRRVTLRRPDDPDKAWSWTAVLAGLDKVRTAARTIPPAGPAAGPRRPSGPAVSGDPDGTPPMAVELDMPGGPGEVAGPPPKGKTLDIAPVEPVHHQPAWVRSLRRRGFHGGALDGLGTLVS